MSLRSGTPRPSGPGRRCGAGATARPRESRIREPRPWDFPRLECEWAAVSCDPERHTWLAATCRRLPGRRSRRAPPAQWAPAAGRPRGAAAPGKPRACRGLALLWAARREMRAPARELFRDAAFPAADSSLFSSFSTPLARFREDITWRRPQVGAGSGLGWALDASSLPGCGARGPAGGAGRPSAVAPGPVTHLGAPCQAPSRSAGRQAPGPHLGSSARKAFRGTARGRFNRNPAPLASALKGV